MNRSQGSENDMTRSYSLAFKQKMIQRLTGKDAVGDRDSAIVEGVFQLG
jgi:hypothetical protein